MKKLHSKTGRRKYAACDESRVYARNHFNMPEATDISYEFFQILRNNIIENLKGKKFLFDYVLYYHSVCSLCNIIERLLFVLYLSHLFNSILNYLTI